MKIFHKKDGYGVDFLEAILSCMADGLIVTDIEQKVIMVNQATQKMLGYSEEEMIGQPIVNIIPDELLPELLNSALEKRSTYDDVAEIINPITGRKEFLTLKINALENAGQVRGVVIVSRDITKEQELDLIKTHFLSLISHELRTPLSVIKAYTETLLDEEIETTKEDEKEFLTTINMECADLSEQINEILIFSELDSRTVFLKKSRISLSQIARDLVGLSKIAEESLTDIEREAMKKGITLEIDIPADLPQFWADQKKIKLALSHLIENGIKFTPPGGKVTLRAQPTDKKGIKISVSDTGIGIALENRAKIFTPFYQLADPMHREVRGIGLGLSLVKHIIEAHSGKIWVESQVGQGSTFTFTLPCDLPQEEQEEREFREQ